MSGGYILHDHSAHQIAILTSAFIPSLTPLGLDIPVGALLLCHAADRSGNGGPTFDGGWKRLDQDANAHDNLILGRIATGTVGGVPTDPGPNILWPNASAGSARGAVVSVWTGDVWPDITTILCGVSDRGTVSTVAIAYNGCSVTDDNALLIAAGRRFKSATANGASCGDLPAPWTQIPASGNVPNGSTIAMAWNYWQQSTKTNTALMVQNLSIVDASDNTQGSVIALRSQIAAGGLGLLDDRSLRGEL